MFNRIFQFGKGNHALTIQVNGKATPLPLAPIPWVKPQQDNASWLEWRAQLTPLIGRDAEIAALKTWLNETHALSFKIIHADGGAGKTRLAAELASAVHGQGWQAGMVSLQDFTAADTLIWQGQTLLVLDYPEHSPDAVDKLIRLCVNQTGSQGKGNKLRVLLLCREPAAVQASLKKCGANAASAAPLALGTLAPSDQYALFQAAMKARSQAQTNDLKPAFIDWQSRNALHHEPLFILALALHLAEEPQASSGTWLAAADLLQYLVERETKRWEGIEAAAGIAEGTLANIAAFCTLFDGLPVSQLREVFKLNDVAVKAMQKGLVHSQDMYQAIQPDLLGARFVSSWRKKRLGLGCADTDAVQLLELCSNNPRLANLLNRWDMVAYDQTVRLQLDQSFGLESMLIAACKHDSHFKAFVNAALVQRVAWNGLSQLAILSYQHDDTASMAQQALELNNHSVYLANAGEHTAALNTAKRAVEIYAKWHALHPAAFERHYVISKRVLQGLEDAAKP